MGDLLSGFIITLLLSFALLLLVAGLFTTYFGAGKSRKIGIVLSLLAVVVGVLTYFGYYGPLYPQSGGTFLSFIVPPIVYVLAAIIGAGAALLAFIGAIMKS